MVVIGFLLDSVRQRDRPIIATRDLLRANKTRAQRAIGLTLFPKHRAIDSTQGRYQRDLFHHRIEFKGFVTRRHLEERLVKGISLADVRIFSSGG